MKLRKNAETPKQIYDGYEDNAYAAGLDGKRFSRTDIAQLVVESGLFERDQAEAERILGPHALVHRLGQERFFGPEHQDEVARLRSRGWKVDFDEFDSEGNTIAGPNHVPEEPEDDCSDE